MAWIYLASFVSFWAGFIIGDWAASQSFKRQRKDNGDQK